MTKRMQIKHKRNGRTDIEVTLYKRIQRVLGSILSRDIDCSDVLSTFPHFFHILSRISIYQSSYHSTLLTLDADIVVKTPARRNTKEFYKILCQISFNVILMKLYQSFSVHYMRNVVSHLFLGSISMGYLNAFHEKA